MNRTKILHQRQFYIRNPFHVNHLQFHRNPFTKNLKLEICLPFYIRNPFKNESGQKSSPKNWNCLKLYRRNPSKIYSEQKITLKIAYNLHKVDQTSINLYKTIPILCAHLKGNPLYFFGFINRKILSVFSSKSRLWNWF